MFLLLVLSTLVYVPAVNAADPVSLATGNNSIGITRTISDVSNPVTNTFTYTITADASNPASVTGLPSSETIAFNNVTPTSGSVSQTKNLDLSGVQFPALGDYKFNVTETASSNSTQYPVDSTTKYTIQVSVRNELSSNVPTGNLVATLASQAIKTVNNVEQDGKFDIAFSAAPSLTYITISKSVTGNLANTDEYFQFALDIAGNTGDTYTILGNHSTDGSATVASSTYTVGTTTSIYLKHGQTVTVGLSSGNIAEMPIGTQYTVAENNASSYETSIDSTVSSTKSVTKTTVLDATATANKTAFVNNKTAPVLTGIFVNVAPFVALVAIATIGIIAVRKTSTK